MAVFQDFQQESLTGDLNIINGDLFVAPSDQQHVSDIILAFPGWWKEFPQLGVGIWGYFNSAGQQQAIISSTTEQLASDGYNSVPVAQYMPDGTYRIYPNADRPQQ